MVHISLGSNFCCATQTTTATTAEQQALVAGWHVVALEPRRIKILFGLVFVECRGENSCEP
eukprot:1185336-Prorocentrum_minimum.AAC.4